MACMKNLKFTDSDPANPLLNVYVYWKALRGINTQKDMHTSPIYKSKY